MISTRSRSPCIGLSTITIASSLSATFSITSSVRAHLLLPDHTEKSICSPSTSSCFIRTQQHAISHPSGHYRVMRSARRRRGGLRLLGGGYRDLKRCLQRKGAVHFLRWARGGGPRFCRAQLLACRSTMPTWAARPDAGRRTRCRSWQRSRSTMEAIPFTSGSPPGGIQPRGDCPVGPGDAGAGQHSVLRRPDLPSLPSPRQAVSISPPSSRGENPRLCPSSTGSTPSSATSKLACREITMPSVSGSMRRAVWRRSATASSVALTAGRCRHVCLSWPCAASHSHSG